MHYLVTGGAGFVGSHVVLALRDAGHSVVVFDNLSTGHRAAVPPDVTLVVGNLSDQALLNTVMTHKRFDGVLHFAALSLVGDSMRVPFTYLRQNYLNSLQLIEMCIHHAIPRFVFSSTAALFGTPEQQPIMEHATVNPGSPYGESKFLIERVLHWAETIYGMHSACLRYFNAAGSDPMGRAGEDHRPETHLIPLAIDTALGRRPDLSIFGADYPTADGTCVRDYIHVTDLAHAHLMALEQIETRSVTYNVGNTTGFSNLDVIRAVERVTGRTVNWSWSGRRQGDPATLIAGSERLRRETGWTPRIAALDDIVETAFRWRLIHPDGYALPSPTTVRAVEETSPAIPLVADFPLPATPEEAFRPSSP
ncbi:UDP-glucose 4-epimerase GalE [Novacetimonas hansenii]|uniref:UDP-glucose 4-epimerase n=1 Tax=Novacetimonas hansenii ATCC 23769 TaxID=714995 RepID=D5QEL2_NOVHA|nr:UDP-glucose 4-epimerase GalE [Novacetimonas hansenii]EFG84423.1 UDP-glucose 4-epimerase [Novacetimonas hansenii ATCC 23769]